MRGYRMGDEFLLPLDALPELGWSAGVATAGAKIFAENSTINLPTRLVGGKQCIPLREAVSQLGGVSSWNPGGYDVLQVASPLYNIEIKNGTLKVDSALAVKPTFSVIGSKKVVVDLEGARFTRDTHVDSDGSTNVSQFGPNTVRIVLNLDFVPNMPKVQLPSATKLNIDLKPESPIIVQKDPPKNEIPVKQDDPPKQGVDTVKPPVNQILQAEIPIFMDWENETASALAIRFQPGQWKGTASYRKPQSDILEIVLSNIHGEISQGLNLKSLAIKEVTSNWEDNNTVIRLKLSRAMGADISASATGVTLKLVRPKDSGGKLNGKVIVLDAGHGGHDFGSDYAGVFEKNITLPLTKYVRDALIEEGVTVIMTRNDDSFPQLEARPALANKNNADLFISIHANKPGSKSLTPSGSITFYHMGSAISKFLGECVHGELMKYKMLPDMGVRSDGTIYKNSGFAVLRLSKMPSILIETGFVTHPKDRKVIQSEEFGRALAKSVVAGLKTFYGQ